ncbi:MAG: nucleoside hydrolase [Clostridia bacterium]|nr:nucleoside hydrolase [Clostridia bacterium]
MTEKQLLNNLELPEGMHDAVLDTDTYNEIDDQFALAYMVRSNDRIRTRAIYAAPFYNKNSSSPEDGMEKSYAEILKVLDLCGRNDMKDLVFKGSKTYLLDENTAVESPAARHLAELADEYSADDPLYVIVIGAITNVASALLINPSMAEKCVVVWLGGHSHDWRDTKEFNMVQDIAAARVVFSSGVPVVQFPCMGVVDNFSVSEPELNEWFIGKNPLADYLARNVMDHYKNPKCISWTKVIWDVTAVSWLTGKFFTYKIKPILLPNYEGCYDKEAPGQLCAYVNNINKAKLMEDLIKRLVEQEA